MSEKKSLIENTFLQFKNLEEAIQENAKGILASTMREEIGELVKESLTETNEQEEEDIEDAMVADIESDELEDTEDQLSSDMDTEDEDTQMGMDLNVDMDTEEEIPMDLTGASDEELLKVFKAMGDNDNIIVKKENGMLHLKDDAEDTEYLINIGESVEDSDEEEDEAPSKQSMLKGKKVRKMKKNETNEQNLDLEDNDETTEFSFDEFAVDNDDETDIEDETEDETSFEPMRLSHKLKKMKNFDEAEGDETEDEIVDATVDSSLGDDEKQAEIDNILNTIFAESDDSEEDETEEVETEDEEEETIYEIELDDEENLTEEDEDEEEEDEEEDEESSNLEEAFKAKLFKGRNPEAKSNKGPKSMKSAMKKPSGKMFGMKPKMGKSKVETKEGATVIKKVETKEAARTLGMGRKFGKKGLPKPRTAPRHLNAENVDVEAMYSELVSLREKNGEYRKALNIFREKLNEVAVFNSNLAYATRLFTEHSTSKQEKINVLRRFDSVETLKESKTLYTTIKEELSSKGLNPITESIEKKIEKTPSSGSAANLIESKTYQNPQFLRMKDLMNKIN